MNMLNSLKMDVHIIIFIILWYNVDIKNDIFYDNNLKNYL